MSAILNNQPLKLTNGLRVSVIHDPCASRAAALIQLAAGSHNASPEWPGLAHLLEHVLFAGSEGFQNDQRLMAWGPAEGAKLNATTLAQQTAWFFEIAAPKLADGLIRLTDMLARPLLAPEAIDQEVRVIEAEYRMLTSHGVTLCEAALSQAFVPHRLQDFHVGNLAHFGEDRVALRDALKAYHQQFFHAQNLQLWLIGPQSEEELVRLAIAVDCAFSTVQPAVLNPLPALVLSPQRAFALQRSNPEQLRLSFVVSDVSPAVFSLWQELLTDKAEGSLLATMRGQGLCDDVTLEEPCRSTQQSLLSVVFQLSEADKNRCIAIEAVFCHWLRLLPELSEQQLRHYADLSQGDFAQRSPVDRLRALAFGFPPPAAPALMASWNLLLAALRPEQMTRLWVTSAVTLPTTVAQGFTLSSAPVHWSAMPHDRQPVMTFWRPDTRLNLPALPEKRVSLRAFPAGGDAVLLLNPLPGQLLTRRQAALAEAALQPVMGECRHRGGQLHFSQQQGIWLLQLSGSREILITILNAVLDALHSPSAAVVALGERLYRKAQLGQSGDIAVRCLLNRLPDLLTTSQSLSAMKWQAALYGADKELHQALARLLSRLAVEVSRPLVATSAAPSRPFTVATESQDAAVIVFCPLAEATTECLATWQALAMLFEPRFFQQFRVDQNIGYAVSCRFHQAAGQAGLLFALQSPGLTAATLFGYITEFVRDMREVIGSISQNDLDLVSANLQEALPSGMPQNPTQCAESWLYQQLNLPPLTHEIYGGLTQEKLLRAFQLLSNLPRRWWKLSNGPSPEVHL